MTSQTEEAVTLSFNYVDCKLNDEDTGELIQFLFDNGLNIESKHDFHATIMYDLRKDELTEPLLVLDFNTKLTASVIGFDVFGEDKDTPVLLLSSGDMFAEHNKLKRAGHEPSYPDYTPHLSLGYDLNKFEIEKMRVIFNEYLGKELTFSELQYKQ